jgi:dihydroxyacetone kinase-like predicted kinase
MDTKKKIEFIDGSRFTRAVTAGSKWLIDREKQLDDINVFPVPDSDTGTNMGGTLQIIADAADDAEIASIAEASKMIADSALIGARGNSGAILAQFFQGLSEGFEKFRLCRSCIDSFSKIKRSSRKAKRRNNFNSYSRMV